MIKEYKVIKAFDNLEVGDILKYDEDCGMYVYDQILDLEGYSSMKTVAMSESLACEYAKSELLSPVQEETVTSDEYKIDKIKALIASLKNTYTQRNNSVIERYKKGKIQPCVKVEHDTVHFNLMKLLTKFEEIINE